jgi:hypothetical protein
MRDLNVTSVDTGVIVATDSDGAEYRIAVDEVTVSRLKRPHVSSAQTRVSPRDIQSQLRAGLTREEVAELTGASAEEVARFEGPVLAELEYIINAALALPAFSEESVGDDRSVTVGARVRTQIENVGGADERWASWRNPAGEWHLKCTFQVAGIPHEGRWSFEPKHHQLTPLNDEAANLMANQAFTSGLIPRLRAVDGKQRRQTGPSARLTETAPGPEQAAIPVATTPTESVVAEPVVANPVVAESVAETAAASIDVATPVVSDSQSDESAKRDTPAARDGFEVEEDAAPTPTADLMAALRKRRSENHDAPTWLAEAASTEGSRAKPGSITDELAEMQNTQPTKSSRTGSSRRNRAQMPTWDEIVFGTKVDDDLI